MKLRRLCWWWLFAGALAFAQQKTQPPATSAEKDIDPQALQILRTALDPLREANSFVQGVSVQGTPWEPMAGSSPSGLISMDAARKSSSSIGTGMRSFTPPAERLVTSVTMPPTIDVALTPLRNYSILISPLRCISRVSQQPGASGIGNAHLVT
jgi:hypothetical protein